MDKVTSGYELVLESGRRFIFAHDQAHLAFLCIQHGGSADLWQGKRRLCQISLSSRGVWCLSPTLSPAARDHTRSREQRSLSSVDA